MTFPRQRCRFYSQFTDRTVCVCVRVWCAVCVCAIRSVLCWCMGVSKHKGTSLQSSVNTVCVASHHMTQLICIIKPCVHCHRNNTHQHKQSSQITNHIMILIFFYPNECQHAVSFWHKVMLKYSATPPQRPNQHTGYMYVWHQSAHLKGTLAV